MKTYLFTATFLIVLFYAKDSVWAQEMWGITKYGGIYEKGVIFKMDEDASGQEVVFSFEVIGYPEGGITQYTQNAYYGMTTGGGKYNYGAIYRFESVKGGFTKIIDFNGEERGRNGKGRMVVSSNGMLYGLTSGGGKYNMGVLFELDPVSGNFIKKVDFDGEGKGSEPLGSLIEASDGNIYGLTSMGGAYEAGIIFRFDPITGEFKKLFDFDGDEKGSNPMGNLMEASDGMLYGMTRWGGANGHGVIFRYDPEAEQTLVIFEFDGEKTGRFPHGSLIEASNGMFYGLTPFGGSYNRGVLFEYDPRGKAFIKKHEFSGRAESGYASYGTPVQAPNGKIYGLLLPELFSDGVLFEYDPEKDDYKRYYNDFHVFRLFGIGSESLSVNSDGDIFFTVIDYNNELKAENSLLVFDSNSGKYKQQLGFNGITTGGFPHGSLIQASNGKLYGTTYSGGTYDGGVIFEYDPVLLHFNKVIDFDKDSLGEKPHGSMTEASNKLYGMTSEGGAFGKGVLYAFEPADGKVTTIFSFDGKNGQNPDGDLVRAANGNLYGITPTGGEHEGGVLFMLDPSDNTFKKIIDFDGAEHGREPHSYTLVAARNEMIYGSTISGGAGNRGVIFEVHPVTNEFKVIIHFDAEWQGYVLDFCEGNDSKLYSSNGFQFNTIDHTFTRSELAANLDGLPSGRLLLATNGKMYGMDSGHLWYKETDFLGGIYEIDLENKKSSSILKFNRHNGANPRNSSLIQLQSTALPVAECFEAVIYLDAKGNVTLHPADIGDISTGSGIHFTLSKADFTCADIGVNTVVMTATDSKGNSSSCSAFVTVADTLAPEAICRDAVVYLDSSGTGMLELELIDAGSFDACGIELMTADITIFDCSDIGENSIELTVTDMHGNVSSCVSTVTVIDNKTPEIHCVEVAEYYVLPGENFYLIEGDELDATASDKCSVKSILVTVDGEEPSGLKTLQGQKFHVGTHTVLWTAVDGSGNQTECANTLIIKKRPTSLIYSMESEDQSEQVIINVFLQDELSGEGIASKVVEFNINNLKDTAVTGQNGVASLSFSLDAGHYPVQISFGGDNSYLNCSYTSEIATSAGEYSILSDIRVYPNPFAERLKIEFVPSSSGRAVVSMFDSSGRLVDVIFDRRVEIGMLYYAFFSPAAKAGSHYYYKITIDQETISGKVIYSK